MQKQQLRAVLAAMLTVAVMIPQSVFASSHREAPITALDTKADITDWYTFVSYDHPDRVTMIMNVDPFLEPSNGPNYFPFDPNVLYEIKVDNNHDGVEDVTFQFRFTTEIRLTGCIHRVCRRHRRHSTDHRPRWSRIRRVKPSPDLHRNHGAA